MGSSTEQTPYGTTIVTLTMNPALDITTSAPEVRPTDKIRCRGSRYDAGGGGSGSSTQYFRRLLSSPSTSGTRGDRHSDLVQHIRIAQASAKARIRCCGRFLVFTSVATAPATSSVFASHLGGWVDHCGLTCHPGSNPSTR